MGTTTGTLEMVRVIPHRAGVTASVGAALDGLLDRLGDGPRLISGDMDSSLLSIAHDLHIEDRALHGRVRR